VRKITNRLRNLNVPARFLLGLSVECCRGSVLIKLLQRSSNGEGDASIVGHREMADTMHCDVSHVEVGMVQPGVAAGHDQRIDVAVERDEPGTAASCRLGEFLNHRRARSELADQRQQGRGPRQLGALVRRAQGDQGVYVAVASEALHVVAGYQATETVADDVDAFLSGGCGQFLDGLAQPYGCPRDVVGVQAVVIGRQRLEAAPPKRALHDSEDHMVLDDPVHQQNRRRGRVHVEMEESALFRAEPAEVVMARPIGDMRRRRERSEWIHHQVCCGPGCLDH
jgi:hypothetical protein